MKRKLFPSDLTDKQWAILAPLISVAKTGGRQKTEISNWYSFQPRCHPGRSNILSQQ
ncbi:MAG: transposase [Chroococcidiopsidaceae cyanobacterium CP_BM_RX_35]|nr:transposase [Chroococcidiopsidaceae cyanobacterium CP_BM_RX_35]